MAAMTDVELATANLSEPLTYLETSSESVGAEGRVGLRRAAGMRGNMVSLPRRCVKKRSGLDTHDVFMDFHRCDDSCAANP